MTAPVKEQKGIREKVKNRKWRESNDLEPESNEMEEHLALKLPSLSPKHRAHRETKRIVFQTDTHP